MPDVREPGEYIQENGGFRPPDVRENGPSYPRILSDRPAARAAGTNGGAGAGPDTSLRVLGKVVPTLTLLGLLSSTRFWSKPTAIAAKTKLTQGPLDYIAQFIGLLVGWWKRSEVHISHEVSKGAVHGAADLVHTIDLIALRMGQLAFNLSYVANDATLVTQRLITHKIPEIVQRYLRPIRVRLGRVERLSGQALLQVRALRRQTRRDLQRLQREQIDPLKKPVRETLPGRIHRVELEVGTIRKVQAHDHGLVRKLSSLLVPALAAAWLVKTLIGAGLRYTTCPNMKDFGNEICASPPGSGKKLGRWLRNLLSLAPAGLLLSDICARIGTLSVIARPFLDPLGGVTPAAGRA